MAIASRGLGGTAAASTSGNTLTSTGMGTALSVGDVSLVVSVSDNISTLDGDNSEVTSVTDSGGNTYTKLGEYTNSGGAAAAGVTCSIWMSQLTTALATTATFTINYSGNIVDRTAFNHGFSIGAGNKLRLSTTPVTTEVNAANGFGSAAFSGLSSLNRLYFRGMGKEANSTASLTPSTGFSLTIGQRSRNNNAAVLARGEFLINTSTGETSNPTLAVTGDTASVFLALEEYTPAVPTVTTQAASSVAEETATANGNITSTGSDATCDARGFVYDTVTHATPGDVAPGASGYALSTTASGAFAAGAYTGSLTALAPNTTYFIRAWSHNSVGYDYDGAEVTFTTANWPIRLSLSSNFAPGATTVQLTPPATKLTSDFVAGRIEEAANPATAIDITLDKYTEIEWSIQAMSGVAVNADVYEFRVTDNGTALSSYSVTPQWTIGAAAINLNAAVSCTATTSAALTTSITPAAAVNCTATTSASLTTAITPAASVSATATTSAALTTSITAAAAASGTATSSASLTTAIRPAASVTGTATTTSALTTAITCAATASAVATTAAALTTQITCAASVSGVVTTSANLSIGNALDPINAVNCTATTSAALTTSITMAAAVNAVATTSAALTTAITAAASVSGIATTSAALTTSITAAASANAVATTSAALTTAITAAAAVNAVATTSAALTTAIRAAASVSGVATTSGSLTTSITAAASANAVATTSASLTTAITMAASVSGVVTTSAALAVGAGMNADAACTATTSASLTTAITAAATATGTASTSAGLTTAITMASSVSGVATTTAPALNTAITMAAAVSATATTSAALTTAITAAASATGTATTSAALTTAISMAASVTGVATTTPAVLNVGNQLDPTVALCAATVSANLTTAIRLASSVTGTATPTATLNTQIALATSVIGAVASSGVLVTQIRCSGAANCVVTISAPLTTQIPLNAQVQAAASAVPALLNTQITMAADVAAQVNTLADLILGRHVLTGTIGAATGTTKSPFAGGISAPVTRGGSFGLRESYFNTVMADRPTTYLRLSDSVAFLREEVTGNTAYGEYRSQTTTRMVPGGVKDGNAAMRSSDAVPGSILQSGVLLYAGLSIPANASFEAWVKPSKIDGIRPIYFAVYLPNVFFGLQNGKVIGAMATGTGLTNITSSVRSVPLNEWTHVAWVMDFVFGDTYTGPISRFYINGQLDATVQSSAYGPINTTQNYLAVASIGANNYLFDGDIDEFAFYQASLDDAAILRHYTVGTTPKAVTRGGTVSVIKV